MLSTSVLAEPVHPAITIIGQANTIMRVLCVPLPHRSDESIACFQKEIDIMNRRVDAAKKAKKMSDDDYEQLRHALDDLNITIHHSHKK